MVGGSGKVSADSVKSSVKNSNNGEFGKVRALLFPIHRHEFKKLIPLSFMFLAVSMTYTMLRSLKDLCMYAYMSADSIYCIKILGIPIMIFFTI